MNTTTTTANQEATMNTTTAIRNADIADVLAAGMDFPMRDALVRTTHASAVKLFQARRAFWIAAAQGYAAQGVDGAFDAAEALAQAERYAA